MDKPLIRVAWQDDKPAIADLNTRAFEQEDEARIITQLEKDGDVVLQLVAELDGRLVGHILFFAIGVRGKLGAVGLGPMSVDPWVQREGIGKQLVLTGLTMLRDMNVPIVFVMGHADYYPKFGFTREATESFVTSIKGPHFFALRLRHGPPMSGELIYPAVFGIDV